MRNRLNLGWALAIAPGLLLSLYAASDLSTRSHVCTVQCAVLWYSFAGTVLYPGTVSYNESLTSYFSAFEAELTPRCVVRPTSPGQVATIVRTIASFPSWSNCQLAIRSGGHTPFAGSANIEGGITIDLSSMKGVTLSKDRKVAHIQTGAQWVDVYNRLVPEGLAVPGARVSGVGVGGFTTGGGISYFSPRIGFTCDSIVNYEVVLANGTIVHANATAHADLWRALRGGSNNFGVVTRMDAQTFEQGEFWGGLIVWEQTKIPQLLQAFYDLNTSPNLDPYAQYVLSIGSTAGTVAASNNIHYTKPEVNPSSLRGFTDIQPSLVDTTRIANISSFTNEQDSFSPNGLRQDFLTATVVADLELYHDIWRLWNASLVSIADATGLQYILTIQPLPSLVMRESAKRGGNALGLDTSDDLTILCLVASWGRPTDDNRIIGAQRQLIKEIRTAAKRRNRYSGFTYLNYAFAGQDAIAGYGSRSQKQLQTVSRKYDPNSFFQKGVPGGFKLWTN